MGARADKLLNAAVAQVRDSGLAHETIRMGTVTAVSSFGTVSVQRNDDVFPVVRLLGSYAPAVGDRVEIANTMGGWICLGPLVDYDTSWQYPTFQTGWSNYGGDFTSVRYRHRGTHVELNGVAKANNRGGTSAIFILPAAYSPPKHQIVPVAVEGASSARLTVYSSGYVSANNLPSGFSNQLSLNATYPID